MGQRPIASSQGEDGGVPTRPYAPEIFPDCFFPDYFFPFAKDSRARTRGSCSIITGRTPGSISMLKDLRATHHVHDQPKSRTKNGARSARPAKMAFLK